MATPTTPLKYLLLLPDERARMAEEHQPSATYFPEDTPYRSQRLGDAYRDRSWRLTPRCNARD